MNFTATGILLFTEKYQECVNFYQKKLELPIIFTEPGFLTTFQFGPNYLMVEINGHANKNGQKDLTTNPTVLRFDVKTDEFDNTVIKLQENGIILKTTIFDWGHTATFFDPDGNRCELYAPLINMPGNLTQR